MLGYTVSPPQIKNLFYLTSNYTSVSKVNHSAIMTMILWSHECEKVVLRGVCLLSEAHDDDKGTLNVSYCIIMLSKILLDTSWTQE